MGNTTASDVEPATPVSLTRSAEASIVRVGFSSRTRVANSLGTEAVHGSGENGGAGGPRAGAVGDDSGPETHECGVVRGSAEGPRTAVEAVRADPSMGGGWGRYKIQDRKGL